MKMFQNGSDIQIIIQCENFDVYLLNGIVYNPQVEIDFNDLTSLNCKEKLLINDSLSVKIDSAYIRGNVVLIVTNERDYIYVLNPKDNTIYLQNYIAKVDQISHFYSQEFTTSYFYEDGSYYFKTTMIYDQWVFFDKVQSDLIYDQLDFSLQCQGITIGINKTHFDILVTENSRWVKTDTFIVSLDTNVLNRQYSLIVLNNQVQYPQKILVSNYINNTVIELDLTNNLNIFFVRNYFNLGNKLDESKNMIRSGNQILIEFIKQDGSNLVYFYDPFSHSGDNLLQVIDKNDFILLHSESTMSGYLHYQQNLTFIHEKNIQINFLGYINNSLFKQNCQFYDENIHIANNLNLDQVYPIQMKIFNNLSEKFITQSYNIKVLKDEVFITIDEENLTQNQIKKTLLPRISNITLNHFFQGPVAQYQLQQNKKNIVLQQYLENKTLENRLGQQVYHIFQNKILFSLFEKKLRIQNMNVSQNSIIQLDNLTHDIDYCFKLAHDKYDQILHVICHGLDDINIVVFIFQYETNTTFPITYSQKSNLSIKFDQSNKYLHSYNYTNTNLLSIIQLFFHENPIFIQHLHNSYIVMLQFIIMVKQDPRNLNESSIIIIKNGVVLGQIGSDDFGLSFLSISYIHMLIMDQNVASDTLLLIFSDSLKIYQAVIKVNLENIRNTTISISSIRCIRIDDILDNKMIKVQKNSIISNKLVNLQLQRYENDGNQSTVTLLMATTQNLVEIDLITQNSLYLDLKIKKIYNEYFNCQNSYIHRVQDDLEQFLAVPCEIEGIDQQVENTQYIKLYSKSQAKLNQGVLVYDMIQLIETGKYSPVEIFITNSNNSTKFYYLLWSGDLFSYDLNDNIRLLRGDNSDQEDEEVALELFAINNFSNTSLQLQIITQGKITQDWNLFYLLIVAPIILSVILLIALALKINYLREQSKLNIQKMLMQNNLEQSILLDHQIIN